MGFGALSGISWKGMSILDIMDFVSNNVLMPIVAFFTCVLVGFVLKTKVIEDEVKATDGTFSGQNLFRIMIKWVAPVFLILILVSYVATGLKIDLGPLNFLKV